ncbi:membrane protein [Kitasatospora xanthocidica]|uniref:DUF2637 domain-containing protein n=1 Tax=Kitasatospora xanthocidica TaxID=83382 RepID=UPI0016732686|nr:DUF2637 domain-containing protein [Kitasatospora xanthocidica]GHF91652.1 membrane protein [Kitasatospora xanthocidica]
MTRPVLTKVHWALISLVALGATVVALIGLAGSYMAVRQVASDVGMGRFAYAFPIGVDAGILVLLALDLVLTWLRIPFPLLRPTAWGLTVATIAFNAAASWPDPLGAGMHAVIPVLFIIISEAARHAISRLARLGSNRTIEKIRLMRWFLAPRQTWAMWRRMQLWEIRSVDDAVRLEQARLAYLTLLKDAPIGPKEKLPAAAHLPLKLAELGVPIEVTYEDGLAAAGVATRPLDRIFAARATAAHRQPEQRAQAPEGSARLPTVAGPRKELAPADGEIASVPAGEWTGPMQAPHEGVAAPVSGRPTALRGSAGQAFAPAGPGAEAFASAGHRVPQGPVPEQAFPEPSQVSAPTGSFAETASAPLHAVRVEPEPDLTGAYEPPDALDSRTALAGAGQPEEPVRERFADLAETTRSEGAAPSADPDENDLPSIAPALADQVLARNIPLEWAIGFAAWVAEYGRHPGPEELRRHLFRHPYNLRARGKGDQPVSLRSVERYYNDLKDLFPPSQEDQERLQQESAGV